MAETTARDDAARLLPCPFCGGRAQIQVGHITKYVMCLQCEVMGPNLADERELAAAWNRRAGWDAHAALPVTDECSRSIIIDAYKGILVLKTMCRKAGLKGGQEASEQLLQRMQTAMPELPAIAALREGGHDR